MPIVPCTHAIKIIAGVGLSKPLTSTALDVHEREKDMLYTAMHNNEKAVPELEIGGVQP